MSELLIVDDDSDLADLLEDALVAEGHHIERAANGAQGLEKLAAHIPDAIVLDVEMPELDGPAMALEMYLHDRGLETVPIVLVSGIVGLPRLAARVGTPYFLSKPYTLEAVRKLCDKALAERVSPVPRPNA
jgi:CheY-like chemotaxis protein